MWTGFYSFEARAGAGLSLFCIACVCVCVRACVRCVMMWERCVIYNVSADVCRVCVYMLFRVRPVPLPPTHAVHFFLFLRERDPARADAHLVPGLRNYFNSFFDFQQSHIHVE